MELTRDITFCHINALLTSELSFRPVFMTIALHQEVSIVFREESRKTQARGVDLRPDVLGGGGGSELVC